MVTIVVMTAVRVVVMAGLGMSGLMTAAPAIVSYCFVSHGCLAFVINISRYIAIY